MNHKPLAGESTRSSRPGEGVFFPGWAGMKATERQEGGDHYKGMAIQPVEYIYRNGIGFVEGCVIKYVSRWKLKGGVEDLKKARHFLDLLIEMEQPTIADELLAIAPILAPQPDEPPF
jgi:hypothetical protein